MFFLQGISSVKVHYVYAYKFIDISYASGYKFSGIYNLCPKTSEIIPKHKCVTQVIMSEKKLTPRTKV